MRSFSALILSVTAGAFSLAAVCHLSAAEAISGLPAEAASISSGSSAGAKHAGSDAEQIAMINELIKAGWQAQGLQPSPTATDGEWCRRIYLDLLGRIPSVDELERFMNDRTPQKKQNLINRLLSDEYVEDYARNWSNIWSILLVGRPPENRDRTFVNREGMAKYLRDTFARNKPYDQMVYDLVSATGSTQPGEENFNGATNFLVDSLAEEAAQATAKTAKLFMGMQVQCTQCHNHPFNDWKQNQFWELNAFFRQTKRD